MPLDRHRRSAIKRCHRIPFGDRIGSIEESFAGIKLVWRLDKHHLQCYKNNQQPIPWLSYGTDWLAFAHLVIALVFVGPLRDPVKNIWVIHFGMIACIGVFPLAFIAGSIRGIPFFWQWVDCSFGVIGFVPLYLCHKYIGMLERSA